MAETLGKLVAVRSRLGDDVGAEEAIGEILAILPPDHPQGGFALMGLGLSAEALEGCGAAALWYRRAYEVRRAGFGADHFQIASAAWRLGGCVAELGDDVEAERLLVDSVKVLMSHSFAEDDPRICKAVDRLADFYRTRAMKEKLRAAALPACGR